MPIISWDAVRWHRSYCWRKENKKGKFTKILLNELIIIIIATQDGNLWNRYCEYKLEFKWMHYEIEDCDKSSIKTYSEVTELILHLPAWRCMNKQPRCDIVEITVSNCHSTARDWDTSIHHWCVNKRFESSSMNDQKFGHCEWIHRYAPMEFCFAENQIKLTWIAKR